MVSELKPRKNIWLGYIIAGGMITSQGASLVMLGAIYSFRYLSLFLLISPMVNLLLIIAGAILLIVGVVLLIHGYQLYKKEKAWDQKMGLA